MSRDHRRLRAFELADQLVLDVYRATREFPDDERLGLKSQVRRSAVSVPANIVEGCARASQKDYIHFLRIAFASLRELGYYISLASRLDYVGADENSRLADYHEETAIVLGALIRSLESQ